MVHIVRERYANDLPIALLEDYFVAEMALFDREELQSASIETLLNARGFMTDRSDYELSAVLTDSSSSDFMDLPIGTPVIQESRSAHLHGVLLNFGRNTYHPLNCRLRGTDGNSIGPDI